MILVLDDRQFLPKHLQAIMSPNNSKQDLDVMHSAHD